MARRDARDLAATAVIFSVALAPRLVAALAWARGPAWDGCFYDLGARRIAGGLGYSEDVVIHGIHEWHPWSHYPVGYSGFLALVYRVFGDGPHVGPIANAFVGALLAAAVHRLARYALHPTRARIAGILIALSPGLVMYTPLLMTEPLASLGLVAAAWLVARDDHPIRPFVLAGATLGLTALVRPESLLFVPALSLCRHEGSLSMTGAIAASARRTALALGCALLVVAPWTARNCLELDGCALVSTNAGWNLAIGAFPRATGRFEPLLPSDGCSSAMGPVEQDRCWLRLGLRSIEEDPARWLALAPKKLGYTFNHESFAVGYLAEADRDSWPEERRARYRSLTSFCFRALLAAAALGLVARARQQRDKRARWQTALALAVLLFAAWAFVSPERAFWPIALAIPLLGLLPLSGSRRSMPMAYAAFAVAAQCATHVVFFGEDRYHVIISPLLALLAAGALRRE